MTTGLTADLVVSRLLDEADPDYTSPVGIKQALMRASGEGTVKGESIYGYYAVIAERLGSRSKKKVDRNTYLERNEDGSISLRFHQTQVLTFHSDGRMTTNLEGGGYEWEYNYGRRDRFSVHRDWYTLTTLQRMNDYMPPGYSLRGYFPRRSSDKEVRWFWNISGAPREYPFRSGDWVSGDGVVHLQVQHELPQ